MVKSVYVPEAGGVLDFADDVTPQEMLGYINTKYPRGAAPGAAPQASDNSSITDRAAFGFGTMFTDVPGGIASLMYPAAREEETWGGRFSKAAREYQAKNTNIDLTKQPTTTQQLAQGIGSIFGFAVPGGLAAKGAGVLGAGAKLAAGVGTGVVSAQGAAVGAEQRAEQIRQQLASGMNISEQQQLQAQRGSALIGTLEGLPMHKFFGPISTLLSKVPASKAGIVERILENRLSKVVKAGTEEALQEAASGVANDIMEYGVYNPDVQIGQDLFTNAAGGALGGSLLEGVIQLAAGRKMRGARQLQSDLQSEAVQNTMEQRRGLIAQAADDLRRTGVDGVVHVDEVETPEGWTAVNITTPDGTPITQAATLQDAQDTIDLYNKTTGAKVTITARPKAKAPEPKPEDTAKATAPVGTVRVYHSGSKGEGKTGRWVSTNKKYASDYRKDLPLFYVDIPANDPRVKPDEFNPEQTVGAGFTFNFELTPEESARLQETQRDPEETVVSPEAPKEPEPEKPAVEPPQAEYEGIPERTVEEIAAEGGPSPEIAPEDMGPEEVPPEMPIGAVEMPVEEDRVGADAIPETPVGPAPEVEPPKQEMRPSATMEDLTALQTELFGQPIGYRNMTPEQKAQYDKVRDERFPPAATDVYNSMAPVTGAPKTFREAEERGPYLKDETPETQEWLKNVYTQLQSRLDTIAPDTKLALKTLIDADPRFLMRGQARGEQAVDGMKTFVDLAVGILEPGMTVEAAVNKLVDTLNHEAIHVLRMKGLIRPAEWNILSKAVANTNMPGKSYTYLDRAETIYTPRDGQALSDAYADHDAIVEEAVADMYRDWVKAQKAPVQTRGLFNRITEFLRRIFRVLKDTRHEKFFRDVEAGVVKDRQGEPTSAATRFSAVPTEEFSGGINEDGTLRIQPYPDLNTGSSTTYLRNSFKRFTAKGRRKDEEWGAALDRAFIERTGRTFDITNPQDYNHIVASVSDEVKYQMQQAQSGVGWYDDDIKLVFQQLGKTFPVLLDPDNGPAYRQMFTMIAGVMSNGMKAKANVELAAINFAHFLNTGKFSEGHPFTGMGWNQRSNIMGPQIAMLNRMIEDQKFAPRPGSNNPRVERLEKFLEFMFTEHSIREINEFRAKHGTKSPAKIGKLDERRLGMYAFGPKFGPFILNLNGLSDETVDSWASRSFYRHMGRGIGPDGELVKAPLTMLDREAMKRALRDVGAATNLSSRDIQAVLWFYEKELYNHFGQSIPLEVFSDGANEFDRKYGAGSSGLAQSRSDRERAIAGSVESAGTQTGSEEPGRERGPEDKGVTPPGSGPRFSAAPALSSEEFKLWFDGSKTVNPDGSPIVFYHGTPFSFRQFGGSRSGKTDGEGPFYFSASSKFANQYATSKLYKGGHGKDIKSGGKMIPVYLSVKNPFDFENPEHIDTIKREGDFQFHQMKIEAIKRGDWESIESVRAQRAIRDAGFDGFYLIESGFKNLAVYKPQQVKPIFNKFEEGERFATRFSAAPLPDYVQQQNADLFAPVTKRTVKDTMFDFFFGEHPVEKTLNVNGQQVTISAGQMKALHARKNVVDKNAFLTEIESIVNQQATGNRQRMKADYSATVAMAQRRRASHLTASMVLRGNVEINFARPGDIQSATMKVVDDVDSLKNVFSVLYQPGPIDPNTGKPGDKREIFRSYAVAKRGEWLRSTGQNVPAQITPRYVRDTVAFTQQNYPEVIEAYNAYQRFNKKLLTAAVHTGLISDAELARLTNQMNYYGFIYEVYGEPLGPQAAQKTASKFKLRAYTGTQRGGLSNDPTFVILQNAQFWVDSMAKNLAATKAFEVSRQVGLARMLGTSESPDEMRGEEPDIMYFSQNGVVKRFAVKDPLLVASLGADDRSDLGRFWELMGLPSRVLRESVTRDPGFMVANLVRDTMSSWITSGANITPFIDTIKGMNTALRDGASYKTLGSYGVVGSYDLAMLGPAELAAVLKRNTMPANVHMIGTVEGAQALANSLWNRLGNLSEASDAATRIAVYEAALQRGESEAEAAAQAVEILDFTRRGGSQALGILTKLIPFLNARIQGMDVLYQAGKAGYRYVTGQNVGERDADIGKKFLLRGGILAAISLALEAWNDDDEDYKQLDDYIKNGNMLIPLRDFGLPGQFIAVPKPFEAGLLFSTMPQQFYKTMSGDASTRDNVALFTSQVASTFGLNPIPQALLPAVEVITNHDFYTGLPLIPDGKARLAPELQYNASTSQLAMMIGGLPIRYDMTSGRWEGISPIVIDNLISGYGGPLGTYLIQATSLALEDANVGPERMPQEVSKLPVVKRFFIDAETKNPKVATQAYELFRVVDEANRSFSRLRQTGDAEAVADYLDKNRDILQYKKYVFKLVDRLNKLSAYERSVERDTRMSREEKLAAQRNIREVKIRLASKVDEINKALAR